jgi:hypothetical protein
MKADYYGTYSEQTRYNKGWQSATDADDAGIPRDRRCGDCMHQGWSYKKARTPRPSCAYVGATSVRATCRDWMARPAALDPDIVDGIVTALRRAGLRHGGAT